MVEPSQRLIQPPQQLSKLRQQFSSVRLDLGQRLARQVGQQPHPMAASIGPSDGDNAAAVEAGQRLRAEHGAAPFCNQAHSLILRLEQRVLLQGIGDLEHCRAVGAGGDKKVLVALGGECDRRAALPKTIAGNRGCLRRRKVRCVRNDGHGQSPL